MSPGAFGASIVVSIELRRGPTAKLTLAGGRSLIHDIVVRPASQFPPIDASSGVRNLYVVQRLLKRQFVATLIFSLVDGGKALWERILVYVELVVKFGIWIASHSFI